MTEHVTATFSSVGHGPLAEILKFIRRLPQGGEILWVTYSLNPSRDQWKEVNEARGTRRMRVLCAHPQVAADIRAVSVGRRAVMSLGTAGVTVRGSLFLDGDTQPAARDSESSAVEEASDVAENLARGQLHAKGVLWRGNGTYRAMIGSFNFSDYSLGENVELAVEMNHGQQQSIKHLFNQAAKLWNTAKGLKPEDCLPGRSGAFVHPPRKTPIRKRSKSGTLPGTDGVRPIAFRDLIQATDDALRTWPKGHPRQGWQAELCSNILADHEAHPAAKPQLLFLPVGLGKTFIALRWLMQRLVSRKDNDYGLFLVPNEWIQRSVSDALSTIAKQLASNDTADGTEIHRYALQRLRVLRPSQVQKDGRAPVAVVADEIHRWRPTSRAPNQTSNRTQYSSWIAHFRSQEVPILGLTATPCRMEEQQFDLPSFIRSFLRGPKNNFKVSDEETKPDYRLKKAIADKLLAQPIYQPLGPPALRARIDDIKQWDTLQFGDYNKVVLKEIWEVLDEHRAVLLDNIEQEISRRGCRRVVVFLPPVGNKTNAFVTALRQHVTSLGGTLVDFRSRTDSSRTARDKFESFRAGDPTPGQPKVLTTIDRFSEGVSVDDIDMLILLRATLSPKVAVQQLGRGIRLDRSNKGRQVCWVLDAVGAEELMNRWEALPDASASSPAKRASSDTALRTAKKKKKRSSSRLPEHLEHLGEAVQRRYRLKRGDLHGLPRNEAATALLLGVLSREQLNDVAKRLGVEVHPPWPKCTVKQISRSIATSSTKLKDLQSALRRDWVRDIVQGKKSSRKPELLKTWRTHRLDLMQFLQTVD